MDVYICTNSMEGSLIVISIGLMMALTNIEVADAFGLES